MAELNSRIKPKKSSVSGEVPQSADLEVAELAVNTADGKLFVKHTDNTIKEISGSGGGGGGGAVDSVNGQTGQVVLGVVDMDDVELPGATWNVVEGSDNSSGMLSGAAYTNSGGLRVHPVSGEGDQKASLRAWVATLSFPVDLTMRFDGTDVVLNCTGISDSMDGSGGYLPRLDINGSWPSTPAYVNQVLEIVEYSNYAPVTSSGDVLVWNQDTEKFELQPIALEDLDDFGYISPGTPVVFPDGYTGDTYPAIGSARLTGFEGYDQADTPARMYAHSSDPAILGLEVGDEVSVVTNNWGAPMVKTITQIVVDIVNATSTFVFDSGLWSIPRTNALNADTIEVTPSIRKQEDGDVLTWVEAIGKYAPVAPAGGGGGGGINPQSGAKVKTAAKSVWTGLISFDRTNNYTVMPDGRVSMISDTQVEISRYDSDGSDRTSDLQTWAAGLTLPATLTFRSVTGPSMQIEVTNLVDNLANASNYSLILTCNGLDKGFFQFGSNFNNWVLPFPGYFIDEFESFIAADNVLSDGNIIVYDEAADEWKHQVFGIDQMQDFKESYAGDKYETYLPTLEYTKNASGILSDGICRKSTVDDSIVLLNADMNDFRIRFPSDEQDVWNLNNSITRVSSDGGQTWKSFSTGRWSIYSSSYGSAYIENCSGLASYIDALADGTPVLFKPSAVDGAPRRVENQPIVWSEGMQSYTLGQPAITTPYQMIGGNVRLQATTDSTPLPGYFYNTTTSGYRSNLRLHPSEDIARELLRIDALGIVDFCTIQMTIVDINGRAYSSSSYLQVQSLNSYSNYIQVTVQGPTARMFATNTGRERWVEFTLLSASRQSGNSYGAGGYLPSDAISQKGKFRQINDGQIPVYDKRSEGFVPKHLSLSDISDISLFDWHGVKQYYEDYRSTNEPIDVATWVLSGSDQLKIHGYAMGGSSSIDWPSNLSSYWLSLDGGAHWLEQAVSSWPSASETIQLDCTAEVRAWLDNAPGGAHLWLRWTDPETVTHFVTSSYDNSFHPVLKSRPLSLNMASDVAYDSVADGLSLVWSENDGAWKPGAAKANLSELGDVANLVFYRYTRNDYGGSLPGGGNYEPGFYGVRSGYMYIHHVDADGADHLAQYQGYDGNPPSVMYFSNDGGATWASGVPTYMDDALDTNVTFRFNNYPFTTAAGEDLLIAFEVDPTSDGYILKWNESISSWAIELGSYVELSTLKAEVAASADFADFQSRIAGL